MIYHRVVFGTPLKYDGDTGQIWRQLKRGRWKETGLCVNSDGYPQLNLAEKPYVVHRVAWFIVYGIWPVDQIDHDNHKRADNRLCNMLLATNKDNGRNQSKSRANTSEVVGVCWLESKKCWMAYIAVDGVQKCIGYFKEFCSAVEARLTAEITYGFHSNHGA